MGDTAELITDIVIIGSCLLTVGAYEFIAPDITDEALLLTVLCDDFVSVEEELRKAAMK